LNKRDRLRENYRKQIHTKKTNCISADVYFSFEKNLKHSLP